MRISDWSSDVCSSDLFGISLWAAIDYGLFHEAKSGVVAGNDGWLYTDEEFIVDEQSDQLVTQNLARIVAVRDRLAAQQVKLVVAIVPAKARVYPEHLRGRKPPQLHEDLFARAEAVLKRKTEERSVGKEGVRTCRSRGSQDH